MGKLGQEKGLIHGFSTRKFGNMSVKKSLEENNNLEKFLKALKLNKKDLIMMEQVHGRKVEWVGEKEAGKVIREIDGLVTEEKGVVLGVKVADCLPVLFFDKKRKIIGVAHAGWKGVLAEIGQEVVWKMKLLGSNPKNVLVGIGPHLSGCCYEIKKDLVEKFIKKFDKRPEMIFKKKNKIHLNLAVSLKVQLIKVGILKQNIESPLACTSCQNDEFYSYRKDSDKTYGEILGVIILSWYKQNQPKVRFQISKVLHYGFLTTIKLLVERFIFPEKPKKGACHVAEIAVKQQARRRGIATKLIYHGKKIALKNGLSKYTLNVESKNSAAFSLYQKLGFKIEKIHHNLLARWLMGVKEWYFMSQNIEPSG